MAKNKLIIASRASLLAMTQSRFVRDLLLRAMPRTEIEILQITTTGDRIQDRSLISVGGKGLFVKEIEEALFEKRADLAVHSLKDVPYKIPQGLELVTYPKREDPRDCLVFSQKNLPHKKLNNLKEILDELPQGAVIGTTSLRRRSLLQIHRQDLKFIDLRGNIDTRLRKLEEGRDHLHAIVLAVSGIKRLGLKEYLHCPLPAHEYVPAVGQGILAIEMRSKDENIGAIRKILHDESTSLMARAERAFLTALEVDCMVPIGGWSQVDKTIKMQGFLASPDCQKWTSGEEVGDMADPEGLGQCLAKKLLADGGEEILRAIKENTHG